MRSRPGVPLASEALTVDCWIGVVHEGDRRVVKLAGRLSAAEVPELLTACGDHDGGLELELSDLVSADAPGIEALQRLQRKGAKLVGVSGYIRLKLDTSTGGPADTLPPHGSRPNK
jgi:hypothetical protein